MKPKICPICKKEFFRYPHLAYALWEKRIYCSKKCYGQTLINKPRWNQGKKLTEEHKAKIRMNNGRYWLGRKRSEESKRKMSQTHKKIQKTWLVGRKISEEHRKNLSLSHLGHKHTKEQIRKMLRRRPMSSLEIKMQEIIGKYNLPYRFVGNGEFLIERKNPDFINTNGRKTAIEVYRRNHKEYFRGGLNKWKKERKAIFNKYDWELLFFDETQVNEDFVKSNL